MLPRLAAFSPELIFFSAGFDAYRYDSLADIELSIDDFFWISQQVAGIARQCCPNRVVSTLEGGYYLPDLGKCVIAHLQGCTNV